jgi:hypothetical protein
MTNEEIQKRNQKIADVRKALDWLETTNLEAPFELTEFKFWGLNTKDEATEFIKAVGTCKKEWDDDSLYVTGEIGSVKLKAIFFKRNICERVVVGTEELPETVIPERVIPASTKEIVEYRCHSSLLASEREEAPAIEQEVVTV